MSAPETPPEGVVEPEPTDAPELEIRTDRPRIWPDTPRAPKPQIKRPLEEWLQDFDERVKQQDARQAHEPPGRRRRARGLARIIPVPVRPERARPEADLAEPRRQGRRRRRGGERGPVAQGQPGQQRPGPDQDPKARPSRDRRRRQFPRPQGQGPGPGQSQTSPERTRPPAQPGSGQQAQQDAARRPGRRRHRGRRRPGDGGQSAGPSAPSGL